MLTRSGGNENPYQLHQELGDVMTKAATVVRHNDQLSEAIDTVSELAERAENCSLSDTGSGRTRTWSTRRRSATCSRSPRRFSKGAGSRRMPGRPLQARVRDAGL